MNDPGHWPILRTYAHAHKPTEFRDAGETPPARHHFTHFMRAKWRSDAWATYREEAERVGCEYAVEQAKRLGHFDPNQPLEYSRVDGKQWATLDGTVYQAPTKKARDEGRHDPASGWHSKADSPNGLAYGSKYSIVETVSDQYQGQMILAYKHVEPFEGKQQGDEAAASEVLLHELKQRAPGLRGAVSDSAFRGTHIQRLTRAGIPIINYPVAASNPNRATGGRNAEGRVERQHKVRTLSHASKSGVVCRHVVHMVGSVPCVEITDATGDMVLTPLTPTGYQHRENKSGSHVFYLCVEIECHRGNLDALIRLDDHAKGDVQGWSRADLARLYPVGTPQFDYIYGRRNSSESLHAKMKRTMPRLPAYGRVSQDLFMLGYQIANNAIALAFHDSRQGEPNAIDFTT